MKDFTDKVAVITGGASGVGRSLAFAFGRRGAKVVVGDVDAAAMDAIGGDLAAENIDALIQHCDVTDVDSLNALADKAEERSLEAYRLEMAFTILGTLQWGFGALLIELLHGT